MHTKLHQLCLALWDPIDCSQPGSSVRGISQARILEWVTMHSSRGSFWSRDRTGIAYVPCTGRWILYHECYLGSSLTIVGRLKSPQPWLQWKTSLSSTPKESNTALSLSPQILGLKSLKTLYHPHKIALCCRRGWIWQWNNPCLSTAARIPVPGALRGSDLSRKKPDFLGMSIPSPQPSVSAF